ncbi:MAG: NADH-quinone oxidoreductase subunit A [Panacibacter sp.]
MAPHIGILVFYTFVIAALLTAILSLSYILGQKHNQKATHEPFESGILHTGTAHLRFSAQFYLVAMLFVIFDVEAVFIMLWAVAFFELGWAGYIGISIFIILLLVVLIYEWSKGAFDFGPDGKKILQAFKKINRDKIEMK